MKDRAGNDLYLGDHVLFLDVGKNTTTLSWGLVTHFTPKMVGLVTGPNSKKITRYPESIVKPFTDTCPYDCGYCHPDEDD